MGGGGGIAFSFSSFEQDRFDMDEVAGETDLVDIRFRYDLVETGNIEFAKVECIVRRCLQTMLLKRRI